MKKAQFEQIKAWISPDAWEKITTIDAHTAGEPLRIIVDGFPEFKKDAILNQRRLLKEKYDHLRTALMWEPRGHADMYGCLVTPPVSDEADFGVLFLHNEGYSTMCGHGVIAVTKVVLETGALPMVAPETILKIDTPAGLVTSHATVENGCVKSVYFHNVPSFVYALDEHIDVPGLGEIKYDIAFGGTFYAFVQAESVGLSCTPDNYRALIEKGMAIKRAIMQRQRIAHPFDEDLSFLYGTIFIAPPLVAEADSRNVCVFAEGEVDRSPTGTGVSARMAIHHARGEIEINQKMVIESIIGSQFTGSVNATTTFGSYQAVIPEVEGAAYITGKHEFLLDPDDALRHGFILR